jgi:hypothetical protein
MRRLLNTEMQMPVWWVLLSTVALIGMSVWLLAELW